MYCSLPGSSVHGILQATILQWVAISFSRGSSQPRNRTHVFCIAGRFFTDWASREAPFVFKVVSPSLPLCLSLLLSLFASPFPKPHTCTPYLHIKYLHTYIGLVKPFGFSVTSYGKTQMNFLASPILRNPISWIPGWLYAAPSLKSNRCLGVPVSNLITLKWEGNSWGGAWRTSLSPGCHWLVSLACICWSFPSLAFLPIPPLAFMETATPGFPTPPPSPPICVWFFCLDAIRLLNSERSKGCKGPLSRGERSLVLLVSSAFGGEKRNVYLLCPSLVCPSLHSKTGAATPLQLSFSPIPTGDSEHRDRDPCSTIRVLGPLGNLC